jgi:uncharacterized protein YaaN involved in tellurite resistance
VYNVDLGGDFDVADFGSKGNTGGDHKRAMFRKKDSTKNKSRIFKKGGSKIGNLFDHVKTIAHQVENKLIMEISDTKIDLHVENYLTFLDFLIFRKTFKGYKKATKGDHFSQQFSQNRSQYLKTKVSCFKRGRFKSE